MCYYFSFLYFHLSVWDGFTQECQSFQTPDSKPATTLQMSLRIYKDPQMNQQNDFPSASESETQSF